MNLSISIEFSLTYGPGAALWASPDNCRRGSGILHWTGCGSSVYRLSEDGDYWGIGRGVIPYTPLQCPKSRWTHR